MSRIWDDSPYSHTMLLLHVAMGDAANDEGEFWYRQETLAKKARVSERYLRDVVKQMIQDGYLETYKRGRRKAYRLLIPELSSGAKGELSSGQHRNSVPVPIEPSVEPSSRNHERTTSSRERGPDMRIPYDQEMPEEGRTPKAKKEPPAPGTNPWVVYRFREVARKHGVTRFNLRHLNSLVKSLREEEGLSNEEIEIVIRVFFTRYGDVVRAKRTEIDPIRIFHQQINSGLLAQAEDLIRKHRRGDTSNVIDPEVQRIMERYSRSG